MSRADELLETLSDGDFPSLIVEMPIVIDDNRKVTVPDALKRIAVQYDHNVETVTFDCPRYWDSHDMSKMTVYINYRCPDGTLGSYIADDVGVYGASDTRMHFDWTISKNVTMKDGQLMFLVCIKDVNEDGEETIHWNSELNTEMYISKGLEGSEITEEIYPDIITQLLLRMDSVETGAAGGYGLGGGAILPPNMNLDEAVLNGWYQSSAEINGAPTGYDYIGYGTVFVTRRSGTSIIQEFWSEVAAEIPGSPYRLIRYYDGSSWSEWEWDNPPMKPDVEYRTTEHIDGKVVYKKNVNGVIQYRLDGETEWQAYTGGGAASTVEAMTITDLGDMGGKTIADLRTVLDNWLVGCGTNIGVGQFSVHKSFLDMWDAEDVTTALESGGRWTCTIIGSYVNSDYVRLMVTSYFADGVYIFTKQSGVWKPTEMLVTQNFPGDITAHYVTGEWLQGTASNHLNETPDRFVVQDKEGWLYSRTAAELMKDVSFRGTNPIGGSANDTTVAWANLGNGFAWITQEGELVDQPAKWGFLLNYTMQNDVFQIFKVQSEGGMYYRSGNLEGWKAGWVKIATTEDILDYGTTDLTAGTSPLATGKLYFVYE